MTKHHPTHRTRRIIRSFEAKAKHRRSLTAKIADWLTSYFGSVGFLVLNLVFIVFWILVNMGKVPGVPVFDPYPYILLITFVSLEAIVLTVIVLMSQNRQSQIATLRDELQLQVELITEKELSKALQLLTKILAKKGVKLSDSELEEMLQAVDTSYIERKLEEQISGKSESVANSITHGVEKALTSKKKSEDSNI
ncbi:MAG: DUF1003 domain-containing protein [Patescibacteria group bacterium]